MDNRESKQELGLDLSQDGNRNASQNKHNAEDNRRSMNVYNYKKEKNIQEENSIDFKKLFLSDHPLKSKFSIGFLLEVVI